MESHNLFNALTKKDAPFYSQDANELFNMLQYTDETDRIEAKEASHGLGKSFLETVSAFSNELSLGGGYILLGVSKNKEAREPLSKTYTNLYKLWSNDITPSVLISWRCR